MKSDFDQLCDNLEFCIETLGCNDQQIEEVFAATNELGVNVEYFCNEFMETSSKQVHNPDYLNIALFNAMFWEW
tara:strand:- start:147 stop:368 length:222 start_codon:yes stop_codon:yes gene_type:complete